MNVVSLVETQSGVNADISAEVKKFDAQIKQEIHDTESGRKAHIMRYVKEAMRLNQRAINRTKTKGAFGKKPKWKPWFEHEAAQESGSQT